MGEIVHHNIPEQNVDKRDAFSSPLSSKHTITSPEM